MKITSQFISIPPYVSTTWANITSLHVLESKTGPVLIIEQIHGGRIEIPGLLPRSLELIFSAHATALEQGFQMTPSAQSVPKADVSSLAFHLPIKGFGEGLEKIGTLLQHNPNAVDTPDLPHEILEKIGSIVKTLEIEDRAAIPHPEEGCNCTFCQIARTIHNSVVPQDDPRPIQPLIEETVTEEDLKFCSWDILQKGDQLYEVTNRLDHNEQYNVYLGEPIGCTCGQRNCEHIRAVLSS